MSDKTSQVYVLVIIQPGKEQEFANAIISRRLILDPEIERIDFVHGFYDFIGVLTGNRVDIDRRIIEMRQLPYVQSTETLIPFEMLNWDDVSSTLKEPR